VILTVGRVPPPSGYTTSSEISNPPLAREPRQSSEPSPSTRQGEDDQFGAVSRAKAGGSDACGCRNARHMGPVKSTASTQVPTQSLAACSGTGGTITVSLVSSGAARAKRLDLGGARIVQELPVFGRFNSRSTPTACARLCDVRQLGCPVVRPARGKLGRRPRCRRRRKRYREGIPFVSVSRNDA
jgi:hypothetical protein